MKKITYLSLLAILVSCTSPLKRNIFETLNVEELSTEFKKDSLFEETYKKIQYINDTVLKSELDKVKWAELSYSRIQEFVNYQNDTIVFSGKVELFRKAWKEKYGKYYEKVDSVLKYWESYKEKNSLEQYVKIELVEIYKERYSYSNDIKNVLIIRNHT